MALPRRPAQVLLKWALQKGYCVIPGSGNPTHQAANLRVYDAELSADEMARLDALRDGPFFYMDVREVKSAAGVKQEP